MSAAADSGEVEVTVRANPPYSLDVGELVRLVRQVISTTQATSGNDNLTVIEKLVLGQRLLFVTIPFAERLAESGPARRQALLQLIEQSRTEIISSEGDAAPPMLLLALDALRFALESGLEAAIVDSFKDATRGQLGQGEGRRTCLQALARLFASLSR